MRALVEMYLVLLGVTLTFFAVNAMAEWACNWLDERGDD